MQYWYEIKHQNCTKGGCEMWLHQWCTATIIISTCRAKASARLADSL